MFKLAVSFMLLAVASAGVVGPVFNCGSTGTFAELRITECSGEPPCFLLPNRLQYIETEFQFSASTPESRFELTARTSSGQSIPFADHPLGNIIGGGLYYVTSAIRFPDSLSGQTVVVQIRLIAEPSNRVEICIQVAVKFG